MKKIRDLEVALSEEELNELWDEANVAIGRLMAGLVGRREWDDDVHELYGVVYDEICGNGFEANLYNALTIPLGVFPQSGGADHARWVWDPQAFREVVGDFRALSLEEGLDAPARRVVDVET